MCSASTSNVRFITFVNTSYMQAENQQKVFDVLLWFEVGALVFSWIEFLYLFYLFAFIRSMHFNLTFLFMNYGGQYFFSTISRFFLIYEQFGYEPDDNLKIIIFYANYVRTIGVFIAMYILPTFMVERCLATFFVKNYEKTRKIWVSLVILSIFHPLVFTSAIAFIHCALPGIFHVISFFAVNIVGFFGIEICYLYNTKRYKKFYANVNIQVSSQVTYKLSERFQLAENIKMCKVLRKVQISIFLFNTVCCSVLIMDFFRVEPMTLYWSHIAFNLLCLIYGITVPYILHSTLPEWQKETRRLVHVLFRLSAVAEAPKSTFGEQMIYNDAAIETNVYFAEFNKRTR